jgi:hypothetical protein
MYRLKDYVEGKNPDHTGKNEAVEARALLEQWRPSAAFFMLTI